jgi:hypothetical protein
VLEIKEQKRKHKERMSDNSLQIRPFLIPISYLPHLKKINFE